MIENQKSSNTNKLPFHSCALVLFILLVSLGSCSSDFENQSNNKIETTKTLPELESQSSIIDSEMVIGKWSSISKYEKEQRQNFFGEHLLELNSDGTFNSDYKRENIKSGNWIFKNDSVIELQLKALDRYKIIDLRDSTMSCQLEFIHYDSVVIDYQRLR